MSEEKSSKCYLIVDPQDYKRLSQKGGNRRKFLRVLNFQYIPAEIIKRLGGTYAEIKIPGAAIPVQQFIANNPYQVQMTLFFNGLGEDENNYKTEKQKEDLRNNTYVKDRVDWLFTFCSSQGANQGQTVRLTLLWGETKYIYDGSDLRANIPGFKCILKSVQVKEEQFSPVSLYPMRATCDIVLESIKQFPF